MIIRVITTPKELLLQTIVSQTIPGNLLQFTEAATTKAPWDPSLVSPTIK
jgi:hypothetical protein